MTSPLSVETGTLYLVSTPIGNLQDISLRALEVLRAVDLILCEDTRTSSRLLQEYDINKPLRSYHDHNERGRAPEVLTRVLAGESVALISDAGTPTIADPGFVLTRACLEAGIPVVPVPGASSILAALVASGLPVHQFAYYGFLPHKKGKRRALLEKLHDRYAGDATTVLVLESPHRIVSSLEMIHEVYGDHVAVCVAAELTKKFERFYRGTPAEVVAALTAPGEKVKGEFVILLSHSA